MAVEHQGLANRRWVSGFGPKEDGRELCQPGRSGGQKGLRTEARLTLPAGSLAALFPCFDPLAQTNVFRRQVPGISMLDREKCHPPGGGEQQESISPGQGSGLHGRVALNAIEWRRTKSEQRLRPYTARNLTDC